MWPSDVCFACLTWPYSLFFFRTLTNYHFVECFSCHHYLLSGCHEDQDSVEQISLLDLLKQIDVPEEVSVASDPEVDLNDDAVGRSRYERFYSVHSNYARENLSTLVSVGCL